MRVTIAAVACLVALVRADAVYAADGVGRAPAASICGEPSRLLDLPALNEAIGVVGPIGPVGPTANGESQVADEGVTLWCVSPDDPRCSPLESSSPSGVSFAQAKLGCAFDGSLAVPGLPPIELELGRYSYRGSARDGVLGRLERPPR
jgi:hypothetical protein